MRAVSDKAGGAKYSSSLFCTACSHSLQRGSGIAPSLTPVITAHHRDFRALPLASLLNWPSQSSRHIQYRCNQTFAHGYLGDVPSAPHAEVEELSAPLR